VGRAIVFSSIGTQDLLIIVVVFIATLANDVSQPVSRLDCKRYATSFSKAFHSLIAIEISPPYSDNMTKKKTHLAPLIR
jgi:hypothetical protein